MEVTPGVMGDSHAAMETYPTREAHPGVAWYILESRAHSRAMEAHPGAIDAHRESWRLLMDP